MMSLSLHLHVPARRISYTLLTGGARCRFADFVRALAHQQHGLLCVTIYQNRFADEWDASDAYSASFVSVLVRTQMRLVWATQSEHFLLFRSQNVYRIVSQIKKNQDKPRNSESNDA